MMLWKSLKASTIVDACVGMSRKRAERLEAAGPDMDLPATERRPGAETGNIATGKTGPEAIQPAE